MRLNCDARPLLKSRTIPAIKNASTTHQMNVIQIVRNPMSTNIRKNEQSVMLSIATALPTRPDKTDARRTSQETTTKDKPPEAISCSHQRIIIAASVIAHPPTEFPALAVFADGRGAGK